MSTRRTAGLVVGGLLAVLLILAGGSRLARARDDAALVRLMRDNVGLDARVRLTQREIAALNRDGAELRAALGAVPGHPGAPPAAPTRNSELSFGDLLAADPRLADLAARAFKVSLAGQYGPLYRRLELSPGQITNFESLLVEHQREVLDTLASGSSQGLQPGDATLVALLLRENEELGTSQMALLGDPGYQQLQLFTRALPLQGIVREVANAVALSPSPLTGEQSDQLTRILTNSNSAFESGDQADPAALNWGLVLAQAEWVLSPSQFKALQGQYQEALFTPILAQFRQQESAGK